MKEQFVVHKKGKPYGKLAFAVLHKDDYQLKGRK